MEETEMKKKGNRVALAFLVLGAIFGIICSISKQEWEGIQLPEPVTLVQKFSVTNVEFVVDEVAMHFYENDDVTKLYEESFFKEVVLAKKVYLNYNILLTAGNTRYRIGIFYFWRHPEGWMESYIEPFVSPPSTKNIIWKLKKVSLNEAKDGIKLLYIPERSESAISGIIRIASGTVSTIFLVISGLIWFLTNS